MSVRSEAVVRSLGILFTEGTHCGLTDTELLERFLSRSDETAAHAFEGLVLRHGAMVLDVCNRVLGDPHDAQDAFQATFLVLATRARSIRRQKSVGSWLHGVALRVARRARSDAARRKAHERRIAEMTRDASRIRRPGRRSRLPGPARGGRAAAADVPRAGRPLLSRGHDPGDGGRAARLSGQHAGRPADAGAGAAEGPPGPPRHLPGGRPAHRGTGGRTRLDGAARFPGQFHGRSGGPGHVRRRQSPWRRHRSRIESPGAWR